LEIKLKEEIDKILGLIIKFYIRGAGKSQEVEQKEPKTKKMWANT